MISKVAGTTRDRKEGAVAWRGRMFRLVDTGGLDFDRQQPFEEEIRRQTTIAMEMADVIVFVADAKGGMLPQDLQIAKRCVAPKRQSWWWPTKPRDGMPSASQMPRGSKQGWRRRGRLAPCAEWAWRPVG